MTNNNHTAQWWKKLEGNSVQCYLCPRLCVIPEGSRGFCFVRQNIAGELILTTYGRSSGFCIDPIEKKPLYHFYPGTSVLSFGTAGCNMGCKFCQNWDISKSKEFDRLSEKATPKTIADTAKKVGAKSVAFTYNDPVIFAEYAIDTAKECHLNNIKTISVTAGYISKEAREEFFENMDAANVDLKSISESFYRRLALAQLKPVLDALIFIKERTNTWLEVTNLIIPGENDSDDDLNKICTWIVENLGKEVPVHFSAFHPSFQMMNYSPTPKQTLLRARQIALSKGLQYVYTGNIDDDEGSITHCAVCHQKLIERSWYEVKEYHLINNRCDNCHTSCAGFFDEKPGSWGSRCVSVKLGDE
ncbi:MAG: AmmeMemoRadiSam system radical SAM enzyme [Candidatus Omnitrophica bacterium]|nr:AmmeMemoRadiSam system radical SAM enzyme [Candidatus Omnitrophota bacterium]